MLAALTGTYLQRVPRWWAGKGPAANAKTSRAQRPHRTRQSVGCLIESDAHQPPQRALPANRRTSFIRNS
ncbi:hypothetical protein EYC55_12655 [Xanthomonas oryzae]|nr:hypothetical protein C7T79_01945 [Xanthomonas oryzae pv. oryzicola]QBG92257.1 hypothetical protein EYR26_12615 [Xanthomonas oryzae]QBG96129.1 hypothetical protein EYC55_12655 [Xanthomonas oryzae]QBH00068.1 hypothetical protein EYC56_13100 [Xanthomonas oryzae]QBH03669.1 hypothetical protein EYC57_09945 [Xanthomonas oryzae]